MNKQLLILEHLQREPQASQRDLSIATGISLGQVNQLIKKLSDDGLLRQASLSKKKVRYDLTQRGMAERARLSNEKIVNVLRSYRTIKDAVTNLLTDLYNKGFREFVLDGDRDTTGVYEVIQDVFDLYLKDKAVLSWGPVPGAKDSSVVLNLNRRFSGEAVNVVNVLQEIKL